MRALDERADQIEVFVEAFEVFFVQAHKADAGADIGEQKRFDIGMFSTLFAEARAINKIVLLSARSGMALSVLLADGAQKKFFHAGGAGGVLGVIEIAAQKGEAFGALLGAQWAGL